MLPKLEKHLLILATLVAGMSLAACGAKKEVLGGAKDPDATVKKMGDESKKWEDGDSTSGKIGKELPNPFDENPTYSPSLPFHEGEDRSTQPGKLPPPPVFDVTPVKNEDYNRLPPDYRYNDESNVERGLSKKLTGAVTDDGLFYTSTSTDDIHAFIRARNEKVRWEYKQANLAAAASVQSAKIATDSLSGDAIVTLQIKEGRDVYTYIVAGSMNTEDSYATPLRTVRNSAGQRTTGTLPLSGTLKCLDLDGGCENIFVRLVYGHQGSSAIINVIFRNSMADLHFDLVESSGNPEYNALSAFFNNSKNRIRSYERIQTVNMRSWEVVNGRSGVSAFIKGYNSELLGFAGPLLAPEAGTGVNIGMARLAKDRDESLDLIDLNQVKLNYANAIGDVRMVANNGLGQVKLVLKMRRRGNFAQDRFALTFMRRVKPIVELTDRNLE